VRILANENVADSVIVRLRERGHDVTWIRVDVPGATDESILRKAVAEQRLLLTFDKDFGELVFARGINASCGVVLFRLAAPTPEKLAERVERIPDSRSDWVGKFSVVDQRGTRMVPLPERRRE